MSVVEFKATIIRLAIGNAGGVAEISVSCGLDAALKELDRARTVAAEDYEHGKRSHGSWAKFTTPSAGGMLKAAPLALAPEKLHDIISVEEREMAVSNDPRAAGQNRTQSGIALPAL